MIGNLRRSRLGAMLAFFVAATAVLAEPPSAVKPAGEEDLAVAMEGRRRIRKDARALAPQCKTDLAKHFLEATGQLPAIVKRIIYRSDQGPTYITSAQRMLLPDNEKAAYKLIEVDEDVYYNTKYGSPLAYVRPIELLASHGFDDLSGRKVLDFGYGSVGQLRLMALCGANVVGVDVDPFLEALYSRPEDRHLILRARTGAATTVTVLSGRFPTDPDTRRAVETGYDLVISKNTLKSGYVHPSRPVDKRMLLNLGLDDDAFVRTLFSILKPGGMVMIYNICPGPSPAGQPYKPWAEGNNPFPQDMWRSAGFEVIEFDRDDGVAVRAMGQTLGWDQGEGKMDLQNDLFAHYSLLRRPTGPQSMIATGR
jgi:hypothetical protein